MANRRSMLKAALAFLAAPLAGLRRKPEHHFEVPYEIHIVYSVEARNGFAHWKRVKYRKKGDLAWTQCAEKSPLSEP